MSSVIRAAVLVLSASLIACTATAPGIAPQTTSVNSSTLDASHSLRSSSSDRQQPVVVAPASKAAVNLGDSASPENTMRFLVSDQATGGLQAVSSSAAGLFQPALSLTNGGDVSIDVQGPKDVSSVSIDTGGGLLALQPAGAGRWQGRLHYLNLNNDPRLPASLTAIVSSPGKNYKITFPVKVIHDS